MFLRPQRDEGSRGGGGEPKAPSWEDMAAANLAKDFPPDESEKPKPEKDEKKFVLTDEFEFETPVGNYKTFGDLKKGIVEAHSAIGRRNAELDELKRAHSELKGILDNLLVDYKGDPKGFIEKVRTMNEREEGPFKLNGKYSDMTDDFATDLNTGLNKVLTARDQRLLQMLEAKYAPLMKAHEEAKAKEAIPMADNEAFSDAITEAEKLIESGSVSPKVLARALAVARNIETVVKITKDEARKALKAGEKAGGLPDSTKVEKKAGGGPEGSDELSQEDMSDILGQLQRKARAPLQPA